MERGALETVCGLNSDSPTGVFFEHQTQEALIEAVMKFDQQQDRISPDVCRHHSLSFSAERFRNQIQSLVETEWERFVTDKTVNARFTRHS